MTGTGTGPKTSDRTGPAGRPVARDGTGTSTDFTLGGLPVDQSVTSRPVERGIPVTGRSI